MCKLKKNLIGNVKSDVRSQKNPKSNIRNGEALNEVNPK